MFSNIEIRVRLTVKYQMLAFSALRLKVKYQMLAVSALTMVVERDGASGLRGGFAFNDT